MNAKEYLLEIKKIRKRVNLLQTEIERLRTDAESVSINLDGMPKGSGKGTWENLAVQLAECESVLMKELSVLWSSKILLNVSSGIVSPASIPYFARNALPRASR